MRLVSVSEMRAIENQANEQGWSFDQMMQQAGLGLADVLESVYGYGENRTVLALVGPGNNGGDALVALGLLAETGWTSIAYLVRPRTEEDPLVAHLLQAGGKVVYGAQDEKYEKLGQLLAESAVLVDGVLGTGTSLPLKSDIAQVLHHVQQIDLLPPVVAVDCPSGVDCDTGEAASETLQAELTVCMAAVKEGLLKFPAFSLAGALEVVDIGLPADLPLWKVIQREVVTVNRVHDSLPERRIDAHKGTFGTVMVAAGSVNYTGAALLAARAAYKMGAGLVQVAVPSVLHGVLAAQLPEATWVLLPHEMGVIAEGAASILHRNLDRATALLLGPGWGQEETTGAFLKDLIGGKTARASRTVGFATASRVSEKENALKLPPLVIDADGLKLLAQIPSWPGMLPAQTVLTPHPGEMAVLTGLSVKEVQDRRLALAAEYAKKWGVVVVLKGALSVIAAPDGQVAVVPVATPALARAGTGDVLAGMIASLLAQGVLAYDAAVAGAWLHAQAGLVADETVGHSASVLASDVVDAIPDVLNWVW